MIALKFFMCVVVSMSVPSRCSLVRQTKSPIQPSESDSGLPGFASYQFTFFSTTGDPFPFKQQGSQPPEGGMNLLRKSQSTPITHHEAGVGYSESEVSIVRFRCASYS